MLRPNHWQPSDPTLAMKMSHRPPMTSVLASRVAVVLLTVHATACASLSPRSAQVLTSSAIEITATIAGPSSHKSSSPQSPVVTATLRNVGDTPLAVCRCFGIRRTWLFFEIQHAGNQTVADAGPEYDLFSEPPYECLRPGATITITKDLFHWYAEFGGALLQSWGPDAYHLEPGQYRLRVGYYDDGQRRLRRCPTPAGTVFSDWLELAVAERGAAR